jgi:hydroxyethylthiazole kinase
MLISPPFLPPRADGDSESTWLDAAMNPVVGDGTYPVGQNMCWHGGLHLEAPRDTAPGAVANARLPVVAIADGRVVVVRQATPIPSDETVRQAHALGYRGWTSDGVVVIEHSTDIGAAADGTAVAVRYYSIYQHLTDIPATVVAGNRIYRKEQLGRAGYISGQPNRFHFEIVCDDANLEHLIGRRTGDQDVTQNGRSNVVFGEIFIRLPAGTQTYNVAQNLRIFHGNPVAQTLNSNATPSAATLHNITETNITTTSEVCYVGLRFANGEGADGHRGDLTLTTYLEDGSVLGTPQVIADCEYNLYSKRGAGQFGDVQKIARDYAANTPTVNVTPSTVYELLRFGRLINTGYQTLTPADIPHWRQVVIPTATGSAVRWVNLNNQNGAQTVRVFSDGDFPQWRGWKIINDDTAPDDNRCDSEATRGLVDADSNGTVTPAELAAFMATETPRRLICSSPCEWNEATIEARWSWLREVDEPMSDNDFNELCRHHRALCFNVGDISNATWHFHPRGFIEAFRKCVWFTADELAQLIPRTSLRGNGNNYNGETISWQTARNRVDPHFRYLNMLFQKYGSSKSRILHNLAQIYIETGFLDTMREGNKGHGKDYNAFYGRGYYQLTWLGNYKNYGKYRRLPDQANPQYTDPRNSGNVRITQQSTHYVAKDGATEVWWPKYDPDIVATDINEAMESSGFYWITKEFKGIKNINKACDRPLSVEIVGMISWLVNGGSNGYRHRQQYAQFIENILLDAPLLTGNAAFSFPDLNTTPGLPNSHPKKGIPNLCHQYPPTTNPQAFTVNGTVFNPVVNNINGRVYYDFQRP